MKLVRTGDQLSGSYFYQRVGTRINLRGNIEQDGNFQLDEFDQPANRPDFSKVSGSQCRRRTDDAGR